MELVLYKVPSFADIIVFNKKKVCLCGADFVTLISSKIISGVRNKKCLSEELLNYTWKGDMSFNLSLINHCTICESTWESWRQDEFFLYTCEQVILPLLSVTGLQMNRRMHALMGSRQMYMEKRVITKDLIS